MMAQPLHPPVGNEEEQVAEGYSFVPKRLIEGETRNTLINMELEIHRLTISLIVDPEPETTKLPNGNTFQEEIDSIKTKIEKIKALLPAETM